ncbi:MAG: hypothetical protein UT61_C0031G0004 [Candidatus Woesebacteria bacterium GW2011_GWA1_39_8]|jgi:hypothetical protein|uniref:Uncharacterized protein n=1 Tax=Candidatus Woesebacteria bacterium GW2011_GWA1_39_8 TaxID=1618552 RepID=A0A0G0PW88_9BACT|nr:MAG: hypothetical protein UT61_C0031G0004 [Candidatus Woesebacteria bacterium GW2011_GWA1_39_8]
MEILSSFPDQTFLVIKVILIVLVAFYTIFSVVLIKQVSLMTQTVQMALSKSIKAVAVLHFFVSLGLLIFVLFA